jgi:hypothetical protein
VSVPAVSVPGSILRVAGLEGLLTGGAVAFAVGALAAAQGGYFPPSWGWAATAFAWTAAIALLVRSELDWGLLDVALVLALAGLTAWTTLSLLWGDAAGPTVLEIERSLVYVSGVAAVLVVGRRRTTPAVLAGLLAAITVLCTYALATRLFPARLGVFDPIAIYRLSEPIGYWNGLGIFASIGTVLAVAFACRSRTTAARFLAGVALPILVCTTYFTFGRAAVLALPLGLFAMYAVDPRRLQALAGALVVSPPAAAAVWLASREEGLTRQGADLASAVDDGRRVAAEVVLLALASGVLAVAFALVERRIRVRGRTRRVLDVAVWAAPLLVVIAVLAHYGGPVAATERAVDAFRGPPPAAIDLNERFLSIGSNGRLEMWDVAWDEARESPLIGNGAGSYERAWLESRPFQMQVRDAHGLYVETFAELGLVGLLLLSGALLIPIVAASRARAHPLVPAALGAYVAYLAHAAVDWDWEQSGVTFAALVAGGAAVLAARQDRSRTPRPSRRVAGSVVGLAVGALAVGGLVGNTALAASEDARRSGDLAQGQEDARLAASWMPWSSDPWLRLGELQLLGGEREAARTSLREGISRNAGDWRLWYHLALAADGAERRRALATAERLNPRSDQVDTLRATIESE